MEQKCTILSTSWVLFIGVGASDVVYKLVPEGENVVVVWYETKAEFSNFGINADLYAPGVSILSTVPLFHPHRYDYASWNGTSMASPYVAGTAALIRSKYPDWSNEMIHGQLVYTTDPINGYNRLNAHRALIEIGEPQLSLYSYTITDTLPGDDRDRIADAGETVEMVFDIQNTWAQAYNVEAILRPHSYEDTCFVTILDSLANFGGGVSAYAHVNNGSNPFLFYVKPSTPNNTDVYFDYEITCDGGYSWNGTFFIKTQRGIEISGIIREDRTLTNDYLYIVTGNVLVDEGVTLTIEPGTRIQFCPEKYLRIDGCLVAIGTEDSMIVFTSNAQNPAPGDWYGIRFTDKSRDAIFDANGNYLSGSIVNYVEIEFGSGISISDASPYIEYNFIHDNYGVQGTGVESSGGITLVSSSTSRVEHNLIRNNSNSRGGGIYLYNCNGIPIIAYNIIEDNMSESGGGLAVYTSSAIITQNIIRGNRGSYSGGSGIYGSGRNLYIFKNNIYNNYSSYIPSDAGVFIYLKMSILLIII